MTEHSLVRIGRPGTMTAAVDPFGASTTSIIVGVDQEILVRAPWQRAEPTLPLLSDSWAEWHRTYTGGWQMLFPNAGNPRRAGSIEHPYHGEAARTRWDVTAQTAETVTMEVLLRTVPVRLTRTWSIDGNTVAVQQRIEHIGNEPVQFSWVEHPAFGGSLIAPGATLRHADEIIDLEVPEPPATHSALRTLETKGAGRVRLEHPRVPYVVEVTFDPDEFPYIWIWQEHRATTGFPFWGMWNGLGIEPASRSAQYDPDDLGPSTLNPGEIRSAPIAISVLPNLPQADLI